MSNYSEQSPQHSSKQHTSRRGLFLPKEQIMFEIASPGHEVQTPPEGVPSKKPTTDGEMIIPPMLSLKPREDTTPKLQNQFKKPYPINRQFAPMFPRTAGSENEAGNRYGASNENR